MAHYINPDDWIPADNFDLEDNALTTVKSAENRIVIAGPGAGKTELLAQRACYLLQTNTCPSPKKILAISFKRDAAFNLAARVEKRVGKGLSRRFTSLTFDAFSKGLVDRFRNGIPEPYRPNSTYKIETAPYPQNILALFEELHPGVTFQLQNAPAKVKGLYIKSLYNQSYPIHSSEQGIIAVLNAMFKRAGQEMVTFPILSRLAQYLLEENPKIVAYLRQTYSHVFLDEFQDTTSLQYELLKAAFLNSNNILTAVGDTKQRIMLWAGAMDGIFDSFKTDFSAVDLPLLMNFRSAPRLIKLQNHLAKELMGSNIECIPPKGRDESEGIAEFWFFDNLEQEAKTLAIKIKRMITEEQIDPREICLLYKQRPDIYAEELQKELQALGIHARVENELQDLLVEPIIQFLICFIYSAFTNEAREERDFLLQEYSKFRKVYDDETFLKLERNLIKRLKTFYAQCTEATEWSVIEALVKDEIEEVTFAVFRSYYPQYNERTFFDECVTGFLEKVKQSYQEEPDLLSAIAKFTGKGCLPIMTIHKSKGLEFSKVFFIGFEDQNFWSYKSQPEEDTCSFFVALSRAKYAVYFTFSEQRINNFGNSESRSIRAINPLFEALETSNLVEGKDFRARAQ